MHVSTAFGVIGAVSNISRTGRCRLDRGTPVFLDEEMHLRTHVGSSRLFTDGTRKGKEVIACRFDLEAGRGGCVELKNTGIQVGGRPFDRLGCSACFRDHHRSIGQGVSLDKSASFHGSIQRATDR